MRNISSNCGMTIVLIKSLVVVIKFRLNSSKVKLFITLDPYVHHPNIAKEKEHGISKVLMVSKLPKINSL